MMQYYIIIKTMFWNVLSDNENIYDISEKELDENLHIFKPNFVCDA